jgi:predicted lipoprotein with Yx(FWY)xxD motif
MRRSPLALATATVILLAACGGGATTTAPAGTPEPTTGATGAVSTASTDLGTILVDPAGFTLYVFTNDSDRASACYDDCSTLWPPVPADTPISSDLDGSLFGSSSRTDGVEQLTVDGRPLYRYTPDTNPGDTTGQGFSGVWFVVGADGQMIETQASSPSSPAYNRTDY